MKSVKFRGGDQTMHGSSWILVSWGLRSADRHQYPDWDRVWRLGFRVTVSQTRDDS